jgi:hypothetical protein
MDDAPLAARGPPFRAFRLSRLGDKRGIEAASAGGDNSAAVAIRFENCPSAGSNADIETENARHVDKLPDLPEPPLTSLTPTGILQLGNR